MLIFRQIKPKIVHTNNIHFTREQLYLSDWTQIVVENIEKEKKSARTLVQRVHTRATALLTLSDSSQTYKQDTIEPRSHLAND